MLLSQAGRNSTDAKDLLQGDFDTLLQGLRDFEARALAAADDECSGIIGAAVMEKTQQMEAFNKSRDADAHAQALADRQAKCDAYVEQTRKDTDRLPCRAPADVARAI